MFYNLLWVTIGNLISGSLIMATGYWLYSGHKNEILEKNKRESTAQSSQPPSEQ
jgi:hypothetical protein